MRNLKRAVSEVFMAADIKTNGNRDWDINVIDERFFTVVFRGLSMGLGESYMDDLWGTRRLDLFFDKLYRAAMEWFINFDANWSRINSNYSERFYRMWKYYLQGMGAAFLARTLQTWDIVLSKQGCRGRYISVR
ncbi:MAG: class I SAM-dependent methyltransferase [Spirochaetes bacterium]|jgi:cyclopropane fatty-acyl-phospholipid synthase-like methyltransferase|nr:class I SAM-dependent methyltransferase [Spirochaetota bacterium]